MGRAAGLCGDGAAEQGVGKSADILFGEVADGRARHRAEAAARSRGPVTVSAGGELWRLLGGAAAGGLRRVGATAAWQLRQLVESAAWEVGGKPGWLTLCLWARHVGGIDSNVLGRELESGALRGWLRYAAHLAVQRVGGEGAPHAARTCRGDGAAGPGRRPPAAAGAGTGAERRAARGAGATQQTTGRPGPRTHA
jgi:hypothetical protein